MVKLANKKRVLQLFPFTRSQGHIHLKMLCIVLFFFPPARGYKNSALMHHVLNVFPFRTNHAVKMV